MTQAACRDCLWTGQARPRCPSCGSPRLLVHAELHDLTIAHLDCDAFYASVEKRDRPELRDVPVIVGGGARGVVTTACYIARMSGVKSAMPMFQAIRACPEAVVIAPDFARYRRESRRIMAMLGELTPLVQPLALDEAWLDLSGTERLHGSSPAVTLVRLQQKIEAETGLGVSIGLSYNRFLAKIASDRDKPRGFSLIGRAEAREFLAPQAPSILPGVGPAMTKTLARAGFSTIGALARADARSLARQFGAAGLRLAELANGVDRRPVTPDQARKAISAETTFAADIAEKAELEAQLAILSERVARQARAAGVTGATVTLKLRTSDFRTLSRRRKLTAPTQTMRTLLGAARELLAPETGRGPFRLIGVGLSDLEAEAEAREDLFGLDEARDRSRERAADQVRERFGAEALTIGRALQIKDRRLRGAK